MTDKWTDDGCTDERTEMMLSHTLTIRGSDVASSVLLRPVV